jgi:hypothetical protein
MISVYVGSEIGGGREIGRKVEEVTVDENWSVAVGLQRSYIKNNSLPT